MVLSLYSIALLSIFTNLVSSLVSSLVKRPESTVQCGSFYGKPNIKDCQDLIYRYLPQGTGVASFGYWSPWPSYTGNCLVNIDRTDPSSRDTVTWFDVHVVAERILRQCTVRTNYGGTQLIGIHTDIEISVTDNFLTDTVVRRINVGDAVLIGHVYNSLTDSVRYSRTQKCPDEIYEEGTESGGRMSHCADTCNAGRTLEMADIMFGLRSQVRKLTLFFCGPVMMGIEEVAGS
ncbi:MAG: hypothetical protein M1835_007332 [Candelina submexicana]|nr:MAG: hypothetical protein M1835_007332 [Candelina submexicana]